MQNRTLIIIAVVLFVVAALLGLSIFAVLYLTTTDPHPVPVAGSNLEANYRIQEYDLDTYDYGRPPPEDVITDTGQIIGRVTTGSIEAGDLFHAGDLRDRFEVVRLRREVSAGSRIGGDMLEVTYSDELPPGAYSSSADVAGKLSRRNLEAGEIVTVEDIHEEEEEFVVVTEQIEPNTIIRRDQLELTSRPPEYPDGVTALEQVVGEVSRRRLPAGEVVRESDLHVGDLQLSHFIPLHRRAVPIPIQNYNAVGYMINPGDLVDIYVYSPDSYSPRRVAEGGPGEINVHKLQKVADAARVLTLNRADETVYQRGQLEEDELTFNYDQITIGVTLSEAEKINLIRGMQQEAEQVRFFVILRPRNLESKYGLRRITNFDLYDHERREGRDVEKMIEGREVEVIHGDEIQKYRVPRY